VRRTKIVCTIGPASSSPEMLDRLVGAGMDVARLNFSHGTHAEHAQVIRALREGDPSWGRPITILQDLQGPKVRLGTFVGGQAMLVSEEEFTLTGRDVKGTASRSSLNHPEFLAALRPGDAVWMDDGMIQLVVETVDQGEVRCRVVSGGMVSDHKGVSFPRLPVRELVARRRRARGIARPAPDAARRLARPEAASKPSPCARRTRAPRPRPRRGCGA